MKYVHLSLAAVLASLLVGCTTASSSGTAPAPSTGSTASSGNAQTDYPQADYRCNNGTEFTIIFDLQEDKAQVMLNGETLTLEGQRPANGMWYSSPRYDFRGVGEEATWTAGRSMPTECRVI